ncbi:hypothetical protein LissoIVSPER_00030, partial [Lissonota sp. PSUC_FEM 10030012]|nr:hypothetical protein [Lissonota sp. PSUC_FEM 10030012]
VQVHIKCLSIDKTIDLSFCKMKSFRMAAWMREVTSNKSDQSQARVRFPSTTVQSFLGLGQTVKKNEILAAQDLKVSKSINRTSQNIIPPTAEGSKLKFPEASTSYKNEPLANYLKTEYSERSLPENKATSSQSRRSFEKQPSISTSSGTIHSKLQGTRGKKVPPTTKHLVKAKQKYHRN